MGIQITTEAAWLRGTRMGEAMSEPVVTPAEPEPTEQPKEVDWKAEARKWEDRAKENLKTAKVNETAAQRLAEIEEANKTAEQKAAERVAAAEQRAAELEAKATRAEVAAAKGVPADLLTGSTVQELEALADALIAFRGDQGGKRLLIPTEGNSPSRQVSSDSEFVKTLFRPGD